MQVEGDPGTEAGTREADPDVHWLIPDNETQAELAVSLQAEVVAVGQAAADSRVALAARVARDGRVLAGVALNQQQGPILAEERGLIP